MHDLIIGTWRLRSLISTDVETGETEDVSGPGTISFGADGRMYTLTVLADRPVPASDPPSMEDAAGMFRSMVSYAGDYYFEGQELIFDIDIAWHQGWVGRRERRSVDLRGDVLRLTTPPAIVSWSGRECTRTLTWERIPRDCE